LTNIKNISDTIFQTENDRLRALYRTKSNNVQNIKSQQSFLLEKTQSIPQDSSKHMLSNTTTIKVTSPFVKQKSQPSLIDSSKHMLSNTTTIKVTSPFVKQKSQSSLIDSSKQLNQVNVDTDTRHRRISNVSIVCDKTLLENSNDTSPKVRVSSGSFFYGQVVAQQQLQAKRNSTMNARPFEDVCPDIKTQSRFLGAHQIRSYFDMPIQKVIFLIFWFQVCVSMHMYYLIMTLKCQVYV